MEDLPNHRKKSGLARRLMRAVGSAGSAVGEAAGDLLKTAGKSARDAGERAALSLSSAVQETPECTLRELAEDLTAWLVAEHQGKAELQQQKPSTVELTELGQVSVFYEVRLEEPGLLGRSFRIVLRARPLTDWSVNLPDSEEQFHAQALLVMEWPASLQEEPGQLAVAIWDSACTVGERNSALDLLQRFLQVRLSGRFAERKVAPKPAKRVFKKVPIVGRTESLEELEALLFQPRPRRLRHLHIVSLAAPGGTGKSYFLKSLRTRVGARVLWAGVDHQVLEEEASSLHLLGGLLIRLARQLEEQGLTMSRFAKEALAFRKATSGGDTDSPSGVLAHLKKAAQTAAGANPLLSAVSAGVVFLTSLGEQAQKESESLARDNALRSLTRAFQEDLTAYRERVESEYLCWSAPVIVFDTYEWLSPLTDVWIRTEFLSEEFLDRSGAVLVLAGREHLLRTDTRWSEWQDQTVSISLKPLERADTFEYLKSLNVPPERFEELYHLTEGLPLFLNLAAHIEELDSAVDALVKRVLEEVEEPYHSQFLQASRLDNFDSASLKAEFEELSDDELSKLRERLLKASFTIESKGKRAFIAPVRRIFERALAWQ